MQHSSIGIKRTFYGNSESDGSSIKKRDNDNATPSKRAKFERTFVPSWLEKYDWLRYDSASNHMYCVLCIKYQKSNAFTEGCQNFRRDNLNKHINTNDHRASCRQEKGDCIGVVPGSVRPPSSSSQGSCHSTPQSSLASADSSADSSLNSSVLSMSQTEHSSVAGGSVAEQNSPVSETSNNPTRSTSTNSNGGVSSPSLQGFDPLPFVGHIPPLLPMPLPLLPRPPLFFPHHYGYLADTNGELPVKEEIPFTPNYLAHPPFPYMSQPMQRPMLTESPATHLTHSMNTSSGQVHSMSTLQHNAADTEELVLKARVANVSERDFIEIELDRKRLTYENLMGTLCSELQVNRTIVQKIRKLPDTIIRKDKDVKRLKDFQEIELVLSSRSMSESSRNYSSAVSPRHIDVVY